MGPQPVIGPAASGGQTPEADQPQPGAPPAAGMVGTTHPHPKKPGSSRSRFALVNWRVRWRLAAVIAVPTLTAAVLGAVTIYGQVSNWQATGRVLHLAQLNAATIKFSQALEDELDVSAASTANRGGFSAQAEDRTAATEGAAAEVARLGRCHHGGPATSSVTVQALNAVQAAMRPAERPQGGDRHAVPRVSGRPGVHREPHPAREHVHQRRRERGQQYRSPARRHHPRRTAAVQDTKSVQRAILLRAVSFRSGRFARTIPASSRHSEQEKADLANFNASVDLAEQQNYSNTVSGPPVDIAAQRDPGGGDASGGPRRTRSPRRMRAP